MFLEVAATCPDCGGKIPLTFFLDEPLSGIRVVVCPECGGENNMGYKINDLYEEAVNKIIEKKWYMLEAAESVKNE